MSPCFPKETIQTLSTSRPLASDRPAAGHSGRMLPPSSLGLSCVSWDIAADVQLHPLGLPEDSA